ncbi:hypothetical protein IAE22_33185, partial [Bacillus sp. S34]|nr:hypothetical protein [Bacillus sp. S34]
MLRPPREDVLEPLHPVPGATGPRELVALARIKRAAAIVKAVTFHDDPKVIAEVSRGLGEAMVGINVADVPAPHRLAEREVLRDAEH